MVLWIKKFVGRRLVSPDFLFLPIDWSHVLRGRTDGDDRLIVFHSPVDSLCLDVPTPAPPTSNQQIVVH